MAGTPTTPETTPSQESPQDFLMREVFAPIFFDKLASVYGLVPQSEAEALKYLSMATKVGALHQQEQTKQASQHYSFLDDAERRLDQILGNQNLTPPAEEAGIQKLAHDLSANPKVVEMVEKYEQFCQQGV